MDKSKKWLKVSDEYEKLQLIADGTVKAHMFVMDETNEDVQREYDREAEIDDLKEKMSQVSHPND